MASGTNPSLLPEIGPDGLAREASVITYTEKVGLSLSLSLYQFCFLLNFLVLFFVLVNLLSVRWFCGR